MVCLPSTVLYKFFWLLPFLLYCVTLIWGATPSRSTPWGAYRSASHTFGTVILNHMPYIPNIPHPRQIKVWWLGIFLWCTCSFLCTCYTGMTIHTLAFLQVGVHSRKSLMLIPQVFQLVVEHSRAWHGHRLHYLAMTPFRTVTHPSTNWAHGFLT